MKRHKIITAIVFAFGSFLTSYAQTYDHFDLSSFITPDIVRNELDFSLNSSGSISDLRASYLDNSSLDADFKTGFNRFKNTRSYWGKQNASIALSGLYANHKTKETKINSYNLELNYHTNNRFYKPDKQFFAIGGQMVFNHQGDKNKTIEDYKLKSTNVFATVSAGVGKGRIEPVTDARQAIYILDNLSQKGVLDRKLSDEEILELSKLIAIVKNKRFFDARLHMIDEITAVDSFFIKNNLLKSTGASYFTTLYDYWMYGDRFTRLSGLEFYAGLTGGYRYDKHDTKGTDSNYKTKSYSPNVGATVSMNYEKPVNLYWQQSAAISLSANCMFHKYNYYDNSPYFKDEENKTNMYNTSLFGSYKWGYYPTSRTNLNFGISEYLSWDGNKIQTEDSDLNGYWSSETTASFQTYYYFSPQLRLSAELKGSFCYQNKSFFYAPGGKDYGLGWRSSFLLTFTYSLF